MKIFNIYILVLILYLFMPFQALADCVPNPDTSGSGAFINYSPFTPAATQARIFFVVENDGTTMCDFEILVRSDGHKSRFDGPDRLDFEILETGGWDTSTTGQTLAQREVTLGAGQSQVLELYIAVPPNQVAETGTYSQGFYIEQGEVGGKKKDIEESNSQEVTVYLAPMVQARLSTDSGNYGNGSDVSILDLGVLEQGVTENVYLQLRGNADAQVTVVSSNGGVLKEVVDPTLAPIDYELNFDGNTFSMSSPAQITESLPSHMNGNSKRMRFRITEDTQNKVSGFYRDIINITVDAN